MSHLLDCSGLLDSGGRASPLGRPHPYYLRPTDFKRCSTAEKCCTYSSLLRDWSVEETERSLDNRGRPPTTESLHLDHPPRVLSIQAYTTAGFDGVNTIAVVCQKCRTSTIVASRYVDVIGRLLQRRVTYFRLGDR